MWRQDKNSILFKIKQRIEQLPSSVLLRQDFDDLGSYRQISRALKALIEEGRLIKISFGVYAKATISQYSGKPMIEGNVEAVLREALSRLQIQFEPGTAESNYQAGKSTQVPLYNIVKLKTRCRRNIGFNNYKLLFEGGINAK